MDLVVVLSRVNALMPRVAVVVPCYRQGQYLPEAIASVEAQTFTDWEVFIIDDGSPDDTAAVAMALSKRDDRIRLLRQSNAGPASARNLGIGHATGEFILPLDADDRLLPRMLERTVSALDARPDVSFAYVDYRFFGDETREIHPPDFDADLLCRGNFITVTTLLRRSSLITLGGFRADLVGYEDWDLWLRAAEHGMVGLRIDEVLFEYRSHTGTRNRFALADQPDLARQIRAAHARFLTPRRCTAGQLKWLKRGASARLRRVSLP